MRVAASVFGQLGKVALGRPVPAHPGDRVLPPALHLLEGAGVRVVAACDHVSQMTILRLDDRISRVSLQPMVTRPTQLLTRHRLHWPTPLREITSYGNGTLKSRVILSFRAEARQA